MKRFFRTIKRENMIESREWKEKNKKYLKELQRFFDRVDNVEDEELRKSIIYQMLRCDQVLTDIAEEMFRDIIKDNKNKWR